MDNQISEIIFEYNGLGIGRGELYPAAGGKSKFFLLEKRMHDLTHDEIDTECVYDSLDELCSDTDWGAYCTEKYDPEWLENYLGEWGYLPLRVAECQPCGTVRCYLVQDYHAIPGAPGYSALEIEPNDQFYTSLEAAGILKIFG